MKSALGTWGLALRIFQSTLIMIVMSFILFATNTFTMKTAWLNILLSALVILLYRASRSAACNPQAVRGHFGNPALASR